MSKKYLQIRICGDFMWFNTMQYQVKRTYKPTASHPTAMTLAGMINCALGLWKTEPGAIQGANLCAYYVHTAALKNQPVHVNVYTDDQTVNPLNLAVFQSNGIFAGKRGKDNNGFTRADGTKDYSGTSVNNQVEYLTGADFTVYIQGTNEELLRIHSALLNPVYCVSIGRHTCLPSLPYVDPNPVILTKEELPTCISPC